jgi:hypothetical protein
MQTKCQFSPIRQTDEQFKVEQGLVDLAMPPADVVAVALEGQTRKRRFPVHCITERRPMLWHQPPQDAGHTH